MPTPQQRVDRMYEVLNEGHTLLIGSYLRTWKATPATLKRFNKMDRPLFKASDTSVYMSQGNNYVCITYCNVRVQYRNK